MNKNSKTQTLNIWYCISLIFYILFMCIGTYKLVYNIQPEYNKFRVPLMFMLTLLQFFNFKSLNNKKNNG